MTYSQQNKRARTMSKDDQNRSLSEELSQVTDLVERRRMQNRISQRNYRNKIRVRLENLEALVEAQNQGKPASEAGSVAGSTASSARSKSGSEHGPAPTPAESLSSAPSVSAATPPDFSQPPCACLQESFGFGGSNAGAELGFLSPACAHTQPFGGPLSTPGTPPPPPFAADSPPSLLGDLDDVESRPASIHSPFAATPGAAGLPAPLPLDTKLAGTVPGFALAPAAAGGCHHPQVHAPCCGQLVAAYPVAMGVPVMPIGLPAMQQHQGQDGRSGQEGAQMLASFPQYLQYAPLGQYQLPQGLGISAQKSNGTTAANGA